MTSVADIVDETQPSRSRMIKDFLATIRLGSEYAFFDLDGTITKPLFDVEDHAVRNFLIPPEKLDDWAKQVGWSGVGDFDYIYQNRHLTRAAYGLSTRDSLYMAGRETGKYAVEHDYLSPGAIEAIVRCIKSDVAVVVLTASPRDVAHGLVDYLQSALGWPEKIQVLGSEYLYSEGGEVTESTWMRGPNKTYVVRAVKDEGARAVFGAGDSPSYSDAFIGECEIPVAVDQKESAKVNETWERAIQLLESV